MKLNNKEVTQMEEQIARIICEARGLNPDQIVDAHYELNHQPPVEQWVNYINSAREHIAIIQLYERKPWCFTTTTT